MMHVLAPRSEVKSYILNNNEIARLLHQLNCVGRRLSARSVALYSVMT